MYNGVTNITFLMQKPKIPAGLKLSPELQSRLLQNAKTKADVLAVTDFPAVVDKTAVTTGGVVNSSELSPDMASAVNVVDGSKRETNEHEKATSKEAQRKKNRNKANVPMTPGVSIKEAFDVTYAVHRLEEEAPLQMKARLHNLLNSQQTPEPNKLNNAAGPEIDLEAICEEVKAKYGNRRPNAAAPTDQSFNSINDGSPNFQLNLDKATLLGRRKYKKDFDLNIEKVPIIVQEK